MLPSRSTGILQEADTREAAPFGEDAAQGVWDVHSLDLSGGRRIHGAALADPALLRAGEAIRFQVFSKERGVLLPAGGPAAAEADADERVSAEFGVFLDGIAPEAMVGTVRLVQGRDGLFPMNQWCEIDPEYRHFFTPQTRGLEIAQLCVSRPLGEGDGATDAAGHDTDDRRALQLAVVLMLYKCMYRWTKRCGITHVFAAMEPTLQRLARRSGFPFEPIGPAASYYGRVYPYMLEIAHLERHLYTRMPHVWRLMTHEPGAGAAPGFTAPG